MRRTRTALCPAILFGQILALAQSATAPETYFQATANLVQVDAIVRENGHPVSDLTAADFELYEDGKPRQIEAITLQSNRTTMFLVDACGNANLWREDGLRNDPREPAPFWGVPYLRTERAVAGFLADLVAFPAHREDKITILSTNEGTGKLEEPSSDRTTIREGLARIPLPGRLQAFCAAHSPEASIQVALQHRFSKAADVAPPGDGYYSRGFRIDVPSYFYNLISQALDALSGIPGHKDLLVFSSGTVHSEREASIIQELTSRANRAGVSIHLLSLTPTPHKSDPSPSVSSNGQLMPTDPLYVRDVANYNAFVLAMQRFAHLATDTGGSFLELPDPKAGKSTREIIADAQLGTPYDRFGVLRKYEENLVSGVQGSSVYLISYRPEAPSFAFHKIDLKVRRPGVTAQWRSGYYDTPSETPPISLPASAQLAEALEKPLHGTSIGLRAMSFDRADEGPKGLRPIIDLVLSMDSRDLTWSPQSDGTRKATVEATAAWYGNSLHPEGTATHNCNIDAAQDERTPAQCVIELDPSAAGGFFVRAAVRDAASGRIGTAYTLAPVPEFNRDGYVTMSSPILRSVSAPAALSVDPEFVPGEEVAYDMTAYGVQLDKSTRDPKLTLRISVASETTFAPIFLGEAIPQSLKGPGWRVPLKGRFRLPPDIAPGNYIVQFLVADTLAPKKIRNLYLSNSRVAGFHIVPPNHAGAHD